MAIAVPWGPSMAINGPSMGIDEVFLTMLPSMGHRWTIDGNRNFPSQKFVRLGHVQNFNRTLAFQVFHSVNLNFVWDFEGAQIFYSEMKLYIVIHIIYLCEKPDSVDFPRKNPQFFDTKTYFKSQISTYFRSFQIISDF